ncbi:MAG: acylglycerol kinase family protein, partial [Terriglobales bacterium]
MFVTLGRRKMRVAAILGLGSSAGHLQPFARGSDAEWQLGMPASPTDADAILIFGGDGTVHRHLPQLVKLGLPVLVVPHGSGNDFARALKLPSVGDALAAWRQFVSGRGGVRQIDLG